MHIGRWWNGSPIRDDAVIVQAVNDCLEADLDSPQLIAVLAKASRALTGLDVVRDADRKLQLDRHCTIVQEDTTFTAALFALLQHIGNLLEILTDPISPHQRLAARASSPLYFGDVADELCYLALRVSHLVGNLPAAQPILQEAVRLYALCALLPVDRQHQSYDAMCEAAVSLVSRCALYSTKPFLYEAVNAISQSELRPTTSWKDTLFSAILQQLLDEKREGSLPKALLQLLPRIYPMLITAAERHSFTTLMKILDLSASLVLEVAYGLATLSVQAAERVAHVLPASRDPELTVWELYGALSIWENVSSRCEALLESELAQRLAMCLQTAGPATSSTTLLDVINRILRKLGRSEISVPDSDSRGASIDLNLSVNQLLDSVSNKTSRSPLEYVVKRYEGDQFRKQSTQSEENARPPSTHLDAFR